MKKILFSVFIVFVFSSTSPRFRDFHCANFFDSIKVVKKTEKRLQDAKLIEEDINKYNSGKLIYKLEDSRGDRDFEIEYYFIKNVFCKGVRKISYNNLLYNKDSTILQYEKDKAYYSKQDCESINIQKDSIYEKSSFLIKKSGWIKHYITINLIKKDSLYISTLTITPIIEENFELE